MVERRPFRGNWHIDAICEHLEAVSAGELRRLIINIPPRHMKSLGVAVFWPTWDWLTHPERQWLFASYAERLSKRDSLKCRRLIASCGGRQEGGTLLERVGYQGAIELLGRDWALAGDQNEKLRFENTETGYRIATSIGGTATGEGGDILVLDDPHKADEAEASKTERDNVTDWIDGTLSTRFNDPKTGAVVVVMQRLHEEDATGHLLERGYTHLCLPAEYEPGHPFIWPEDPRTDPGQVLWEGHFDPPELETLKQELGSSRRVAGQLQQLPNPADGDIFEDGWWRFYEAFSWPKLMGVILASWDLAFKKKSDTDFVVGQLWGAKGADRYLLAQVRARLSYPETKKAVQALARWAEDRDFPGGHRKLVEDKANGPAIVADLRSEIQGLIEVTPEGGKEARAHAVTGQIESGNVYIPEGTIPCPPAPRDRRGKRLWSPTPTEDFIAEHRAFPNGVHDDQVDALSQALTRLGGGDVAELVKAIEAQKQASPAPVMGQIMEESF